MATISLDPEALEQLGGERKALLDAIDSLRKHGIGRLVDLPQIIVVGDQSSGKSSVLEAISRVRFPVKDGLCTRFATELVLRTDPQTKIDVRVQPMSVSAQVDYTFNETRFDKEDLPRIVELAKTHMLRDSKAFSEDVLRIEISSPDVPHLTLVDLPGFYHSEDENQDAAGRKTVDRLVESYMARKNSIILAIVSARNQLILQKVLSRVKGHDKNQQRTLGIITKPDLLTHGSQEEDRFIKLARNQEKSHQLALGWHVLRNRGETEDSLSSEERDAKEAEFFESGIWSAIPSNNRGVDTLRKKLSNILLDHIRDNLDALIKDIESNMNLRQSRLRRLGDPRSSPRELRAHLDKIASQFQILALHAVEGDYSDEFFGDLYPGDMSFPMDESRIKKIRALVRDLNRTFAYVLATKGSRRVITSDRDGNSTAANGVTDDKTKLPSFLRILESQYPFDDPKQVARNTIRAELEPLSAANQGNEFPGTTNDLLAVKLFRDQSRPWAEIAQFHVDLVLRVAKAFTEKLVEYITGPDAKTYSAILQKIVDPFFEERKSKLDEKIRELLYHFRSGYPQPLDAEFRVLLSKRRQESSSAEMVQSLLASRPELFTQEGRAQLAGMASNQESEFGVDSLIDKSETYYELSLRTFADNVIILGVENCLIKDLPTILTTSTISQMDDVDLKQLAAESDEIQVERAELQAEYEALKKGFDMCKRYRARNKTVLPAMPIQATTTPNGARNSERTAAAAPLGSVPTRTAAPAAATTTSSNRNHIPPTTQTTQATPAPSTVRSTTGTGGNFFATLASAIPPNRSPAPDPSPFPGSTREGTRLFGSPAVSSGTTQPTSVFASVPTASTRPGMFTPTPTTTNTTANSNTTGLFGSSTTNATPNTNTSAQTPSLFARAPAFGQPANPPTPASTFGSSLFGNSRATSGS